MNLTNSLDYNNLLYSLKNLYSSIKNSNISFFSVTKDVFIASGLITFSQNIYLVFRETIDFSSPKILKYVYEVYQDDKQLYFYDPQPHPEIPDLASTFPHHKHIHPDIKHNRQPAPGISFDKPNLPFLIEEIIENIF